MQILHIGHSSIESNDRPLALRDVLHPNITKNLLSVHKFTRDNDVFFEFHPWSFLVKDRNTRSKLLEGRCEGGLYPISSADAKTPSHALMSRSTSRAHWHARLGHPSSQVVQSILFLNKIPYSKLLDSSVCNACQLAKSHQLPYSLSTHRSTRPLELVFSDVWALLLRLLADINTILVLLMILASFHGYIYCITVLKLLKYSCNSKLMLNAYWKLKSNLCSLIRVGSINLFTIIFFVLLALVIVCLAPIRTNRMVPWNTSITTSWKQV